VLRTKTISHAGRVGFEPTTVGLEPTVFPIKLTPHGGSIARNVYPQPLPAHTPGLEPGTNGLTGRYSAIELCVNVQFSDVFNRGEHDPKLNKLPTQDSNLDLLVQSQVSCRWTNGHY
jgi:hypothetical protein